VTYAFGQCLSPEAPYCVVWSGLDWPIGVGRGHRGAAQPCVAVDLISHEGADISLS
jgi:hypothetical protein